MTHRQNSFRPRNYSSCSNSSSASVSPSSSSTLNFTLYGGPAPRSLHRTTTGAAKAKPKRRSNKPTPPPPTSPLSLCCPDDGNFHDFKLDLSSLSIEDETIMVSNGTEIYYSEHNVLVQNSLEISHHDVSDTVMSSNVNVNDVHMNKCQSNYQVLEEKNCENNGIGTSSNSTRSTGTESDKDLNSQTCSELDFSSQGYVEVLFGNDSYRSNVSNSSSYITVSECSVSSLSSMPSSCSSKQNIDPNNHAERIDPVNHIENGPSENDCSTSRTSRMSEYESKNVGDTIKIETGNGDRILSCNETQCIKKKSQYESNDIRYLRRDLKYRTIEDTNSVSPEINSFAVNSGKNCKESSQVNNLTKTEKEFDVTVPKQLFTVETDSQNFCPSSTSFTPYETDYITNYENSDKGQSTDSCDQPELYGYYVFGEGHETPSDEWTVEDESGSFSDDLCPNEEISSRNYGCHIKSDSVLKGGKIPFKKFSKINENSFSVRNANSYQESLFAEQLSPHSLTSGNCLETGSSKSQLHFRTLPKNQISYMNDKTVRETLNLITADETKMKVQRRVVSAPIHSRPIDRIRSCDVPLDSDRRTMFLLESLESGYFSDIPAPDITMTAGDIMEAVLYARQLVRVLERTLDKALLSAGNMSVTTTPLRNQYVEKRNKNRRCRSLSPNLLRHCKGMSNSVTLASSENCVLSNENESGVEGLKSQSIDENVKLDDGGYEKRLSCEGKCDGIKCCKPCIISITPEQLQQQRALLKPAAQRSLQETVAQVLDMADILKSVISKRRLVMDPSEELICGTNRSVSEWSLENSPRNDN